MDVWFWVSGSGWVYISINDVGGVGDGRHKGNDNYSWLLFE